MLEIICLIWLWRKNGRNAALKGQNPRKYQWMTLALWFGMEFAGCFAGALIMALFFPNDSTFIGAYILGCTGACIGGYMSYVAAKNAPQADQRQNPWEQQNQWNNQNSQNNPWNQQQTPDRQNPWDQQPGNPGTSMSGYNLNQNPLEAYQREEQKAAVNPEDVLECSATVHIICEKGGYEGCQETFFLNGELAARLTPGSDYALSTKVKKNIITIGKPKQDASDTEHSVKFIASEMGYVEIHASAGKLIPEKFKNFK